MVSKKVNQNVIKLSGTHDVITVPNSVDRPKLSFGQDGPTEKPFSISAWVFVVDVNADATHGAIACIGDSANNNNEYNLTINGSEIAIFLYDTGANPNPPVANNRIQAITNASPLSSRTWHHIVATYDGSKSHDGLKIYVDGALAASNNVTVNVYNRMYSHNTVFQIGGLVNVPAGQFEDRMADVCIFDKELSADEINEVYNGGKVKNMVDASTYNNLISWWKMGDDQDNSGALGIKDYKGLNHGTLVNGASILLDTLLGSDSLSVYGTRFFIPKGYGKVRRPKSFLSDKISRVNFGQYADVVIGNNPLGSTYYEDGEVYRDINGEPTLISYSTENERYLHLTLDLQNYSHHPGIILVCPWFWYRDNKRFFRPAPLGNPYQRPGLDDHAAPGAPARDGHPNMETDFSHLSVPSGEIRNRVIDLYGADKVFFQIFGLLPNAVTINSLGNAANNFIEVNDIHLYASLSTF